LDLAAPPPPGRVIFLADAHLAPTEAAALEFIRYMEPVVESAGALYLLGDVFHYAVGLTPFRMPGIDQVLSFFSRLKDRGVVVGYVGGNREFYLRELLAPYPGIVFTEEALDIVAFGVPIHLVHGDQVNRDDRQYLRWRKFSRGRMMRLLLTSVPRRLARSLGDSVESRMRSTNRMQRIRFPESHCRRYAENAVANGARLVLMGHFHQPRTLSIESDGKGGRLQILPDWMSHRAHGELGEDGELTVVRSGGGPS
jgi:UDP-2,3-diacylglucosamine hydrolase